MEYIDRLIASVTPCTVGDVLVGCFTTCVTGSDTGIASTLKPPVHSGFGLPDAGDLAGRDITELAQLAYSDNLLAASVGIAAINSDVRRSDLSFRTGNARELVLKKGAGRTLGMIGHFPFIDRVRDNFKDTLVFELNPQPGDLSAVEIPERLAEADIVAVTATTLINHTFERVMAAVNPDAYVVMLGPSTPLNPVLFDFGIDALCGSLVTDRDRAFEMIRQAAPFRCLQGIAHVMLLKEDLT